jgi:hypothetical protein
MMLDANDHRWPLSRFCFFFVRLPAHSETLKISATGRSFTQLPIRIAQVKGFYRDEKLEVVYVQMTGQLATASLFGGHVDATTAFSASATATQKNPRIRNCVHASSTASDPEQAPAAIRRTPRSRRDADNRNDLAGFAPELREIITCGTSSTTGPS